MNAEPSPALVLAIGITALVAGALFIASLIVFCVTKRKGWLITMIVSVLLGAASIGVPFAYGIAQGIKTSRAKTAGATSGVITSDQVLVMFPPADWSEPAALKNEDAIFKRGNLRKEEYCLIFNEKKSDLTYTLPEYMDIVLANMASASDAGSSTHGTPTPLTIDGCNALQVEVSAIVQRTRISYFITVIDTGDHYSQIMMWTLQSRQATAFNKFRDVVNKTKVNKPAATAPATSSGASSGEPSGASSAPAAP